MSSHLKPTIVAASGHHTSAEESCAEERSAIRDNLGAAHPRLDVAEPEVLELAAEFVTALHSGLVGRASVLCGDRRPDYRRGQCIGRERWTEVDLAWLCLHAPTAARDALRTLLAACGEPLLAERDLVAGMAHAGEEMSSAITSAVAAMADGHATPEERRAMRAKVLHLRDEMDQLLRVIDQAAPWQDQVEARVEAYRGQMGGRP